MIFQSIVILTWQLYWQITAQVHAHKSQHETILADLNQYKAAMCLLIILTDDAIKQTCIWPLTWHKYNDFSPFHLPVKEKRKHWRMKGLGMVQWINLNWNNRSVSVYRYSVLWEKTGPIFLPLVGLMAGRQMKYWWVSKFLKFSTG